MANIRQLREQIKNIVDSVDNEKALEFILTMAKNKDIEVIMPKIFMSNGQKVIWDDKKGRQFLTGVLLSQKGKAATHVSDFLHSIIEKKFERKLDSLLLKEGENSYASVKKWHPMLGYIFDDLIGATAGVDSRGVGQGEYIMILLAGPMGEKPTKGDIGYNGKKIEAKGAGGHLSDSSWAMPDQNRLMRDMTTAVGLKPQSGKITDKSFVEFASKFGKETTRKAVEYLINETELVGKNYRNKKEMIKDVCDSFERGFDLSRFVNAWAKHAVAALFKDGGYASVLVVDKDNSRFMTAASPSSKYLRYPFISWGGEGLHTQPKGHPRNFTFNWGSKDITRTTKTRSGSTQKGDRFSYYLWPKDKVDALKRAHDRKYHNIPLYIHNDVKQPGPKETINNVYKFMKEISVKHKMMGEVHEQISANTTKNVYDDLWKPISGEFGKINRGGQAMGWDKNQEKKQNLHAAMTMVLKGYAKAGKFGLTSAQKNWINSLDPSLPLI